MITVAALCVWFVLPLVVALASEIRAENRRTRLSVARPEEDT